ncbi:zinc ribbon domain regulatory protein CdsZ [Rhabdochlamydiaceae symbiont of Dictyostelium giganteum]|uniref:zinc ribbon domain regulatory protein CdsZ n=1 Tax=Rhabdochlamydiaceae symbiont of Dictyostelium giganteum TaxID=3342349 RepID=UPI00384EA567
MKEALKTILDIQELDMKMLRLIRVKKERLQEIEQIEALRQDLHQQVVEKEKEIAQLSQEILMLEQKIQEIVDKIKKLEAHQGTVKKVEEFNSVTQEMAALEKERASTELKVSDLVDKKVSEEEILGKIKEGLLASEENSLALEKEIKETIQLINQEGRDLKAERDDLAKTADVEVLKIYQRLFTNKKDRVVVPLENRTCSGCHIALTAQHENVVRKGNNLVFCEHCSRIHYFKSEEETHEGSTAKRRRKRLN